MARAPPQGGTLAVAYRDGRVAIVNLQASTVLRTVNVAARNRGHANVALSVCLSVCSPVSLSVCALSVCLFVCLPACLPASLPAHLFVQPDRPFLSPELIGQDFDHPSDIRIECKTLTYLQDTPV